MSERILHICSKEDVTLQDGAMACLSKVSGGDLRKAITTLQSAVRLAGKRCCHLADLSCTADQSCVILWISLRWTCHRGCPWI
jgi:DNA polymerase III delta prime subunit